MDDKISRREFSKKAALAGLGLAVPSAAISADPVQTDVEKLDRQLAKPLGSDAKKIAKDALAAVQRNTKTRLRTKLPENSEPCTIYVPARRA